MCISARAPDPLCIPGHSIALNMVRFSKRGKCIQYIYLHSHHQSSVSASRVLNVVSGGGCTSAGVMAVLMPRGLPPQPNFCRQERAFVSTVPPNIVT